MNGILFLVNSYKNIATVSVISVVNGDFIIDKNIKVTNSTNISVADIVYLLEFSVVELEKMINEYKPDKVIFDQGNASILLKEGIMNKVANNELPFHIDSFATVRYNEDTYKKT